MRRVTRPLGRMGASFREQEEPDRLPIRVSGGGLRAYAHQSPVASAQVKSALLLAGLTGGVPVEVIEPGRSRDHTERMLRRMGAEVTGEEAGDGLWRVRLSSPPGSLRPLDLDVPGDFSSAAFLLVLGALRGDGSGAITVADVGLNPTRTGLLPVLQEMGARIRAEAPGGPEDPSAERVANLVVEASELTGVSVGGELVPTLIDELPILAVAGARARGTTEIRDAAELRVKESDRIRVIARNLAELGVKVEELRDGLRIHGSEARLEGRISADGDHRIAMAFGVLGALPGCRVEVDDPGVAGVSFPGFWELLGELAGSPGRRGGKGREALRATPDGQADLEEPERRLPLITVDGPAGSGKSTTAQEVARRLGFRHLDSGSLYRALTLAVLEAEIDEEEWEGLATARLEELDLRLESYEGGFRILLEGRDPGEALRSSRVTERVSRLAGIPAVRRRLLGLQREAGRKGGVVADGRDMGTVVFPDAEVKVYLTASLEERARRRLLQEGRAADPGSIQEEARRIRMRDASDEDREASPLRQPEGALVLETTDLTFERQVERIVEAVRRRFPGVGKG
jgi:3-phosphoshikimate 1-carboxyvinyltransferase